MMAAERRTSRNVILIVVAIACLAYAGYAIRSATKAPPTGDRDEVRLVCTGCWEESAMTTAEYDAAMDEETTLVRCPHCGEFKASTISLYCPHCKRAIPRSMVVFGTAHVCPFCKGSLDPSPRESD
jgi:DNA-directed RNA polymerase subunit RPC12/RpoP